MAGFGRVSRTFQKQRKKNGSSRRWALKARKSLTTSSDSQVKINKISNDTLKMELGTTHSSEPLSCYLRNGVLYKIAGRIILQCQHRISQIWSTFWNILSFWRVYTQRVEILHQRVEELQSQLHDLRSNVLVSNGRRSCCHCEQSDGVKVSQNCQQTSVASPPPPPPPPLPPPPTIQVQHALPIITKKRPTSMVQEKADRCVAVTLKDLQAVQLKKVTPTRKFLTTDGPRAPLITLAELQKVRLRRTLCSFPSPMRPSFARTPVKSPMRPHLQLRKSQRDRPAGRTPLRDKENIDKVLQVQS